MERQGSKRDLVDTLRIAQLEQRLLTQAESIARLTEEWDELQEWAKGLQRKYVPCSELLAKLESLRPF